MSYAQENCRAPPQQVLWKAGSGTAVTHAVLHWPSQIRFRLLQHGDRTETGLWKDHSALSTKKAEAEKSAILIVKAFAVFVTRSHFPDMPVPDLIRCRPKKQVIHKYRHVNRRPVAPYAPLAGSYSGDSRGPLRKVGVRLPTTNQRFERSAVRARPPTLPASGAIRAISSADDA